VVLRRSGHGVRAALPGQSGMKSSSGLPILRLGRGVMIETHWIPLERFDRTRVESRRPKIESLAPCPLLFGGRWMPGLPPRSLVNGRNAGHDLESEAKGWPDDERKLDTRANCRARLFDDKFSSVRRGSRCCADIAGAERRCGLVDFGGGRDEPYPGGPDRVLDGPSTARPLLAAADSRK
jgi:hypothetical protein